jgi:hypothetical protein
MGRLGPGAAAGAVVVDTGSRMPIAANRRPTVKLMVWISMRDRIRTRGFFI